MRRLLQPRWVAVHVLVLAVVVACVNLGFWQLRRLDERRDRNDLVEARAAMAPEPIDELAASSPDPDDLRFRAATVAGEVAAVRSVRTTRDGAPGVEVLAAVRLDGGAGTGVAVLAGFTAADAEHGIEPGDRIDVGGVAIPVGRTSRPVERETAELVAETGLDLLGVLLQAGEAEPPLEPLALPELGDGPHLSYAVQWFVFATVAAAGYPFLLRRRMAEAAPPRADGAGASSPGGDGYGAQPHGMAEFGPERDG